MYGNPVSANQPMVIMEMFSTVSQACKVLDDKGVKVRLVVVDGLTHYQVPAFVPFMREAIPWIKRAWKK